MLGLDAAWALIFGGCCSNVFALEAIIKHEPDSGLLITVLQFALTALYALPSQLTRSPYPYPTPPPSPSPASPTFATKRGNTTTITSTLPPSTPSSSSSRTPRRLRLKRPTLPLSRLATMSLMFFAVNMLNNWAFAFDISVPLHIILRSFGSVTTLACGWAVGKRYSRVQVASVAALTVGVCVSAWADARAKGKTPDLTTTALTPTITPNRLTTLAPGLLILLTAQLISAYMGIYTETTYALHGRHWRETLFYSHALGLAFSLVLLPSLIPQAHRLFTADFSTPTPKSGAGAAVAAHDSMLDGFPVLGRLAKPLTRIKSAIPPALPYLLLNSITQVACISGVNRLSSQTTAVTVTIVLNIRKLASFLLSCLIFGNRIGGMMGLGAGVVFVAGGVYGWDGSRRRGGGVQGSVGTGEGEKIVESATLEVKEGFKLGRKRTVEVEAGTGGGGTEAFGRRVSANGEVNGHVRGHAARKASGRYIDGKLA